jgi:transcriptional regulator with XRE-family HTH domain
MNQTPPTDREVASLLKSFESATHVTAAGIDMIMHRNQAIDRDPKLLANIEKTRVVNALRRALEKRHESQSSFAQRWNKTRQYVSRIFNIEEKTNFTIETIMEAAVLLDRRLTVQIHGVDQEVVVRTKYAARPPLSSNLATETQSAPTLADGANLDEHPLAA